MTWSDIKFPFPSMTFMIPSGLLKESSGSSIYALGISRFPHGFVSKSLIKPFRMASDDRIDVFWMPEPVGLTIQDCAFPVSQKLEPDSNYIDEVTYVDELLKDAMPAEFSCRMAGLAANLLLLMMARPELVEAGAPTGKRLPKSGRRIHAPTFIGRKYAIDRRGLAADPKAHFTELRWRAGHMRRQHFGKGRSESKIIWIDPYIAHSAGLEVNEQHIDIPMA